MIKKKINEENKKFYIWVIFIVTTIIFISLIFIRDSFGISYFSYHVFLHAGIIVFCFGALINSLKLNERASGYFIFGFVSWIILEAVHILSHVFEEYALGMETNLLVLFGTIIIIFLLLKGFCEAVGGKKSG